MLSINARNCHLHREAYAGDNKTTAGQLVQILLAQGHAVSKQTIIRATSANVQRMNIAGRCRVREGCGCKHDSFRIWN